MFTNSKGETFVVPRSRGLLRQRDLGLAARHVSLDALPGRRSIEARSVVSSARLQLRNEALRPVDLRARRLRGAPQVLVTRVLGLDPRLLEMGHEQRGAIELAVQKRAPLVGSIEPLAVLSEQAREVLGQQIDLLEMMLDTGPRLLGGTVSRPGRPSQRHDLKDQKSR